MVWRESSDTSSPSSRQGPIARRFFGGIGARTFLSDQHLRGARSVPQTPPAVGHVDSLHKAMPPRDVDELEKAFQDLQCLECLFLDMEEEENVNVLLQQVPIQLDIFHDTLQNLVHMDVRLEFQKSFLELKQNWKQEGESDGPFLLASDVQDGARELMLKVVEFQEFTFHYKHRQHTGFAVHVLALHPNGDDLLASLLWSKADPLKYCWSSSKDKTTFAEPLHVAAGGGQMGAAELLLEAGVHINTFSFVEPSCDQEKGRLTEFAKGQRLNFAAVVKRAYPSLPFTGSARSNSKGGTGASGSGSGSGSSSVRSGRREQHYTALHEATFFQQEQMVKFLLLRDADVNAKNLNGDTALHWSARQGNSCIARLLVHAKADVKAKNESGKTPLETAVESGNFPRVRLSMLMQRQISEIMTVAKSAPNAAKELLRDVDQAGSIAPSWRPRLLDRVTVDQWVELMELAPQVAEDVLEAVTVTPVVVNNDHHPLPRQASFWNSENMRCKYIEEDKWTYNASEGKAPGWHGVLAPRCRNFQSKALRNLERAGGFERKPAFVRVKMVRIPGLMNRQVLRALKDTDHLEIFTKLAAQAIIQCAWHTVVKRFYFVHLIYRVVEIGILVAWSFLHFTEGLFREAAWSWLFVSASRELFYELCEIRGYMLMTEGYFVSAYLMDAKNLFDLCSIFMLLGLCIQTWSTQMLQDNLPLLAAVVASRWVQLVYTFRAFPMVGRKVLPIIQSFRPLSGIFFITVFIFMGFLHAFVVLDSELQTEESIWTVFTSTFRFLFLGDGDAVDVILGLGGRDTSSGDYVTRFFLVLGIMGFSILILNLFIAGAHQAYEEAHNSAEASFFRERADISLQCLFRPTCPIKCWRWLAFVIIGLSIPTWMAMLMYVVPHPALASLLLFFTTILSDSVLLQHGWRSKSRQVDSQVFPEDDEGCAAEAEDTDAPAGTTPQSRSAAGTNSRDAKLVPVSVWEQKYLWFCYRVECESDGDGGLGEMGGSGSSLLGRKGEVRANRFCSDVRRLRRDTENLQYNMDYKLSQMKDGIAGFNQDIIGRLDRLENSVMGLVASMERIGLAGPSETSLPEGWESARAPNGRIYYYNRTLKRRQWEKPPGSVRSSPRPCGVPQTPPGSIGSFSPMPQQGSRQGWRMRHAGSRSQHTLGHSYSQSSLLSNAVSQAAVIGLAARHDHQPDVVIAHSGTCSPIAELTGSLSMSHGSNASDSREASAAMPAGSARPAASGSGLGHGAGSREQLQEQDPAEGAAGPAAEPPAPAPSAEGGDGCGAQQPCSLRVAGHEAGAHTGEAASDQSLRLSPRQRPEPLDLD